MEIPEERNMEKSRDVGDAGRCLKQSSKRSYGAKKKRFAGKPKQNRWNFTQEGTPVSESKEGRHLSVVRYVMKLGPVRFACLKRFYCRNGNFRVLEE